MHDDATGKKVLFSWLGTGDIRHTYSQGKLSGALADAINAISPAKVYLLDGQDYETPCSVLKDGKPYAIPTGQCVKNYLDALRRRLGDNLTVKRIKSFTPIDYRDICKNVIPFLREHYTEAAETYFLQTSGTPSTAVVWVLLAQTAFPARLLQTSEGRTAETIDLPFKVVADFIPSKQDSALAALVTDESRGGKIIYSGEPIRAVISRIDRVALHDVPVLLLGESGTGKELFAERIHENSGRKGKLIKVNCGAINPNLAEAELFGATKGAFTGAERETEGKFEAAHQGTLFLDEIGELPLELQVKLLRALQDGANLKVGGNEEKKVDVRVVAATHRDILAEVAAGRFREDLFYRLAVGVIHIPPLRERGEDALLIAEHILGRTNKECKATIDHYAVKSFDKSVKKFISDARWPGNVRELSNTVRRVCIWLDGAVITADDLKNAMVTIPGNTSHGLDILNRDFHQGFNLDSLKDELEKHYLKKAHEKTGGNQTKMAELLGWSRPTVKEKIKKYIDG